MANLRDVYAFYWPNTKAMDKDTRNIFVEGTVDDIKNDMNKLIEYNFGDVEATVKGKKSNKPVTNF